MKRVSRRGFPGVKGKVVDWIDTELEEGVQYIRIRFQDQTELCFDLAARLVIEEADLSDWSSGNYKQKRIYIQSPERREIAKQDKLVNRICTRLDKEKAKARR